MHDFFLWLRLNLVEVRGRVFLFGDVTRDNEIYIAVSDKFNVSINKLLIIFIQLVYEVSNLFSYVGY